MAYVYKKIAFLSAGQTRLGLTKAWYGNYNGAATELGGSSCAKYEKVATMRYYDTTGNSYHNNIGACQLGNQQKGTVLSTTPSINNTMFVKFTVTGTVIGKWKFVNYTGYQNNFYLQLNFYNSSSGLTYTLGDSVTQIANSTSAEYTFTLNENTVKNLYIPDFYISNTSGSSFRFITETGPQLNTGTYYTALHLVSQNTSSGLYFAYTYCDITVDLYATYLDI